MIRQIRGTVLSIEQEGVVVEVGGGFGVFVRTASPEVFSTGAEAALSTHLAVKQDGLELYGFPDPADLAFFELLLQVSGVGPKTALSILKRAPREALENAIAKRDIPYLTRVVGLGKKAAEKLAVELSEKMKRGAGEAGADAEVFDMLVALGYTEREARKALTGVPAEVLGTDARFKAALASNTR
ncbi:MAG: Holliday junction branch migration protein RuvA [bacterium]